MGTRFEKESEMSLRDLTNNNKMSNICIIRVHKTGERVWGIKTYLKK